MIVNTARGAIMDEAALVAALDDGRVASVGLDVFEDEPEVHPGLLANPHVLLLPHMGTWSEEVSATGVSFWGVWGGEGRAFFFFFLREREREGIGNADAADGSR